MADTLLRGGICLKESSILSQVITRYFALSRFYVFAFDPSKCDAELVLGDKPTNWSYSRRVWLSGCFKARRAAGLTKHVMETCRAELINNLLKQRKCSWTTCKESFKTWEQELPTLCLMRPMLVFCFEGWVLARENCYNQESVWSNHDRETWRQLAAEMDQRWWSVIYISRPRESNTSLYLIVASLMESDPGSDILTPIFLLSSKSTEKQTDR